jgi:transposase
MSILYVGIDLAKNVFAVHGVNEAGAAELRQPKVTRAKLHALIASLPPCVVGMEACSGAHHWARLFQAHGHTVRLMAPKFVAPYRMSGKQGKNDAADAMAICEAVQRPNMRFVPIKTEDQQSRLLVHRARQGFVQARTATVNRIRGLMSEFGVVLPLKAEVVRCEARNHLEELPGYANTVVGDLLSEVAHLDERIKQYDAHIRSMARDCALAQRLMQLTGVGETSLGRITKAGDSYIRSLLVLGARAVLNAAANKTDSLSRWAIQLRERRGYWKAVIAIAAKNARMAWAVLTKGEAFKLPA